MIEYKDIFYWGVALFILPIIIYMIDSFRGLSTNKYSIFLVSILTLFCFYIFVNRPILAVTDTEAYIAKLHIYKNDILFGKSFTPTKDIAWDFFSLTCAYLDLSSRTFLFVCSLLFISPLVFAYRRLFLNNMLLPYYLLITCFFFYSLGTNVLRTGISFSFFMLALSYRDKIKIDILFCVIAILFHLSFILPIILWFFFRILKIELKYIIVLWFGMLLIAYLNIPALNNIIAVVDSSIVESRISSYVTATNTDYKTGFKLNFVLFSLFFGAIGLILNKKIFSDDFYDQVLKIYIATNAFFLLTMNIPFSDRFALLSWVLIPIICTYPLIKSEHSKCRSIVFFSSLLMLSLNFIIF